MAHIWDSIEFHHQASIFLTLLLLTLLFKWFTKPSNKPRPPSPPKLPIIGNLHQLGSYPHRTLRTLARRYGPLMLIHLGSAPAIVVSSADVAEEIMRTHDIAFSNRLESRIYNRLLYDRKDLLMAPYGEYWRQLRGLCATQLLSATRVQSLHYIREEETESMIQKIRRFDSHPFNLSHLLEKVTNDIVCRASLGKRFSKEEEGEGHSKLSRVFQELNALLGLFNIGEYIPWLDWINNFNGVNERLERNYRELDELLEEIIEDHVATLADSSKENRTVLLDVLLGCQNSQEGFCITRDSIKAIVLDVFAGGSDTTYVVLEWAMTELLRHPEALKKAQKEVRGIVGSKSRVTRDDLAKMSYLKAVLKESMRIHPSVPLIPRVSNEDVVVNGFAIPAGTRVLINIWAIGTDPMLWEEPEKFEPERFLDDHLADSRSHDFKWMAFGGGRRRCPGEPFGMALVEFVLASLLLNFDWSVPGEARGADLDMTEFIALALHRMHPLVVVASPNSC